MTLSAAANNDTMVVTIKNTLLEFVGPTEDSARDVSLSRTNSSPCPALSPTSAKGTQWADMEDSGSEEGGSSFGLARPAPQRILSDLLQALPCEASGKDPEGASPAGLRHCGPFGVCPGATATAAAAEGTTGEAAAATLPARTRLRASAVAYVPPVGAAAPWPQPSPTPQPPPTPQPATRRALAPAQADVACAASIQKEAADYESWPEGKTVMLKNMPIPYTRDMLIELLRSKGFLQHCNFLYVPMNFQCSQNVGYAFLNLTSEEHTNRFFNVFEGFRDWAVDSDQVCVTCWSNTKGLIANVERYRNSPIMREDVPDAFKPTLLSGGRQVAFPSPTKQHLRRLRCRKDHGMRVESAVSDGSSGH